MNVGVTAVTAINICRAAQQFRIGWAHNVAVSFCHALMPAMLNAEDVHPRFAIMGDESIQDIVARGQGGANGAKIPAANVRPIVEVASGGPVLASAA